MGPTPQVRWPLLEGRTGARVWVKHENHTPIGSFKLRGGLVYCDWLVRNHPGVPGVIAATRGNFGQSIAFAARQLEIPSVMVVPRGNSTAKNAAMRSLGAELVEQGHDFQAAYEHARQRAEKQGLHFVPSFHRLLWLGTATAAMELLRAEPDLEVLYVPIGQGSGICGAIAARHALRAPVEIVGVVAQNAAAYALSFEAGRPVATDSADTIADGLACRVPDPEALQIIRSGVSRIVAVPEAAIREGMRIYFSDTRNVAEGAGAAALAALMQEKALMRGRTVAVMLSGGNVDPALFEEISRA